MDRLTAILLVVGFISIAVFGFIAMGHGEGHNQYACVAAASQAAPCPQDGPVAWALFHAAAYKGFSTAVISVAVLAMLLAAVIAIFAFAVLVNAAAARGVLRMQISAVWESVAVSGQRLLKWLTICEKRDPSVFFEAQARLMFT
ncbi:hypothetical protein HYW67_02625 [Candidatus Parcubacteria bacterium]|nr:hypothetical protein [Candidatus Parcubacteria bacterium]